VYLSIVIPAYNEARRLPRTLQAWAEYLKEQQYVGEVVVADDGSRDETAAVVREYGERDSAIRLVALPVNQGKGGAVKAGMLAARGDYIFYVDADLNIAPEHVPRALRYLEHDVDVVAGQRGLAEYAGNERSVGRLTAGALVQGLRRTIVLPTIRDTQCGFKGFRRPIAKAIFERTLIRSFAFDIEVLFLARQMRAVVMEMPVATEYRPESTYALRKHLVPMLSDIVRIRANHLRGRYDLGSAPTG
jgi:dolichyl-phosphate beta-glucosyltransferase